MGAYPPVIGGVGFSYTIKLGEEWKGTWAPYYLADDWWYIPSQGHCSVMVRKDQFFKFGGYPKVHRCYGGGEFYIDMKWWMLGSNVAVNPHAIGYHLSSGRGYSYNHSDYVENVLGVTYALGCDDWRERVYLNALRKTRKEQLDITMARNEIEYAKEREFVSKRTKKTFNELILERPWDVLNQKRHGKSNGAMTIFHYTWLELMMESPIVLEAYRNSKYQKELEELIETKLKDFIYLGKNFDEARIKGIKDKIYAQPN
jgi:hypothetical protein